METVNIISIVGLTFLSAIMAGLQMAMGEQVPTEFWTVMYAVLGVFGVPIAYTAVKKAAAKISGK